MGVHVGEGACRGVDHDGSGDCLQGRDTAHGGLDVERSVTPDHGVVVLVLSARDVVLAGNQCVSGNQGYATRAARAAVGVVGAVSARYGKEAEVGDVLALDADGAA